MLGFKNFLMEEDGVGVVEMVLIVVIFYIIAIALCLSGIGAIGGVPLAVVGHYLQREVNKIK